MPTMPGASAGAGAGKQGSGGELLVGLGEGVSRTTVGNSGSDAVAASPNLMASAAAAIKAFAASAALVAVVMSAPPCRIDI